MAFLLDCKLTAAQEQNVIVNCNTFQTKFLENLHANQQPIPSKKKLINFVPQCIYYTYCNGSTEEDDKTGKLHTTSFER